MLIYTLPHTTVGRLRVLKMYFYIRRINKCLYVPEHLKFLFHSVFSHIISRFQERMYLSEQCTYDFLILEKTNRDKTIQKWLFLCSCSLDDKRPPPKKKNGNSLFSPYRGGGRRSQCTANNGFRQFLSTYPISFPYLCRITLSLALLGARKGKLKAKRGRVMKGKGAGRARPVWGVIPNWRRRVNNIHYGGGGEGIVLGNIKTGGRKRRVKRERTYIWKRYFLQNFSHRKKIQTLNKLTKMSARLTIWN